MAIFNSYVSLPEGGMIPLSSPYHPVWFASSGAGLSKLHKMLIMEGWFTTPNSLQPSPSNSLSGKPPKSMEASFAGKIIELFLGWMDTG